MEDCGHRRHFAATLAAMDAVGVDGLVASVYWGFDGRWREEVANAVFRSYNPFSEYFKEQFEACGVDRIKWASHYTQARAEMGITRAQALDYVLESDQLSETEKQWLLGGNVRTALPWAKPV